MPQAGRSTQLGLTCETFKDISEQLAQAGGGAVGVEDVCICWQILTIVVILYSPVNATVMFCTLFNGKLTCTCRHDTYLA